MSRATLSRLAEHPFFEDVDFSRKGTLSTFWKGSKDALSDVIIIENDYAQYKMGILYGFLAERPDSNYVQFFLDPKSQMCVSATGAWENGTIVRPSDTSFPSVNQEKSEALFSDFLTQLESVSTPSAYEDLIARTLRGMETAFPHPKKLLPFFCP